MRTNITFALAALAAVSLASSPARAEQEHRELGPHVHGHGTLNVAVQNERVEMELIVPGMDIVGFEHAAKTDAQKAVLEKARRELEKPLTLFKLPAAAGCSLANAKIAIEAEQHHDDEDDAHDEHAHDEDAHDEHAGHNQFHVIYALNCTKPANLTSIDFIYFNTFAGARDLTVNLVTAKAQSSYEVSRDEPSLDLAGMM
jgi:hypothetical protein